MAVDIDIKKQVGNFRLDIKLRSDSERIGFLGASGSGKSMTLKCIAGIEKPDSGHIIINGTEMFNSDKKINLKPQKRKVGYLFQNYALFPSMTAEQNISAVISGGKQEKQAAASELIHTFGLHGCEKKYPRELSGGEQQRTALARLIASKPDIVLLDEAFSALDSRLKEQLQYDIMQFLTKYKLPSIIVSHDKDEIYKMTDNTAVIYNGAVNSFGDTKELFKTPRNVISARLTGCKNISPIKRLSERTVYASDWDMTLDVPYTVHDRIAAVGIYPHLIQISSEPPDGRQNSIPLRISDTIHSLASDIYICKTNKKSLWAALPAGYDIPQNGTVTLPKDKLILLE